MPNPPDQDPIERYLDEVCTYFKVMPKEEAERNRVELRQHIEIAVDEIASTGLDSGTAIESAIKRFGAAKTVGRRIANSSPYALVWKLIVNGLPSWLAKTAFAGFYGLILFGMTVSVPTPAHIFLIMFGSGVCIAGLRVYCHIKRAFELDYDGMSRDVFAALYLPNLNRHQHPTLAAISAAFEAASTRTPSARQPVLTIWLALGWVMLAIVLAAFLWWQTEPRYFAMWAGMLLGERLTATVIRLILRPASIVSNTGTGDA